jgi:hypothetical protein
VWHVVTRRGGRCRENNIYFATYIWKIQKKKIPPGKPEEFWEFRNVIFAGTPTYESKKSKTGSVQANKKD